MSTGTSSGKRAGARRAARRSRSGQWRKAILFAVGVTLTLVAWGYLVSAAIDFGTSARAGDSGAWLFLTLAVLGAIGCLFATLMLASRVLQVLGVARSDPEPREPGEQPRPPGGRRAKR